MTTSGDARPDGARRAACGWTDCSRSRRRRSPTRRRIRSRRPPCRRPGASSTSTSSRSTSSRPRTARARRPGARAGRHRRPHAGRLPGARRADDRRRPARTPGRPRRASPARRGCSRSPAPAPGGPPDPCAPPGDPLGQLPDGLFRVEVLDGGSAGDRALRVVVRERRGRGRRRRRSRATRSRSRRRPRSSSRTATCVEVSWLARRADRVAHGALYTISQPPRPARAATSSRSTGAVTAPAGADGLVVRRWDGEAVGAAAAPGSDLRGDRPRRDASPPARARTSVGDWWGARVREEEGARDRAASNVRPDGIRHAFAPLALVDLGARTVLHDCRPTFVPLTAAEARTRARARSRSSPATTCRRRSTAFRRRRRALLAAGVYALAAPLQLKARKRIVVTGAGPATILRATKPEAALRRRRRRHEIEIRHIRGRGRRAPAGPATRALNGAITVDRPGRVASSPTARSPAPARRRCGTQTCITVRTGDGRDVPTTSGSSATGSRWGRGRPGPDRRRRQRARVAANRSRRCRPARRRSTR